MRLKKLGLMSERWRKKRTGPEARMKKKVEIRHYIARVKVQSSGSSGTHSRICRSW